jgi:hypothetical protein
MMNETLNVVEYFENTLKEKNISIIKDEFERIFKNSKLDLEKNAELVNEINKKRKELKRIRLFAMLAKIFFLIFIGIFPPFLVFSFSPDLGFSTIKNIFGIFSGISLLLSLIFFIYKIKLKKKNIKDGITLEKLISQASNNLLSFFNQITQQLLFDIIEKTYKNFKFKNISSTNFLTLFKDVIPTSSNITTINFFPITFFNSPAILFKKLEQSMYMHT